MRFEQAMSIIKKLSFLYQYRILQCVKHCKNHFSRIIANAIESASTRDFRKNCNAKITLADATFYACFLRNVADKRVEKRTQSVHGHRAKIFFVESRIRKLKSI